MTRTRLHQERPQRLDRASIRRRMSEAPSLEDDVSSDVTEPEDTFTEETVSLRQPRSPLHRSSDRNYREPDHEPDHNTVRRTRRRKATAVEDIFYIPVHEIPEGSSYEWKRWSIAGQEDPFYLAQLREQGWEPVSPKRHPTWVPPDYHQPFIIKGGMILMERPIELTEEARAEQRSLARDQIRVAEARLGHTPKNTLERVAPNVVKEVGRMVPTVSDE